MPKTGRRQLEILSGWKEIANYLGKGVRTVQRYERELRLPIRRPARRSWGSVIATKAEIDAWISASPLRETFRLFLRDGDTTARIEELRKQLAEMHRLRAETAQWRNEMAVAQQSLQRSIAGLQERLRLVLGEDPDPKRRTADLLTFDPKRKPS